MLVVRNGKVVMEETPNRIMGNISQARADIAANSDETLPADCPIMSTIFVVDKMKVIVSDGKDNWYREADKPFEAGKPISSMFE